MSDSISSPDLPESNIGFPKHVAIIMDGNNRWARARGLAGTEGHRKGAERVKQVVKRCAQLGIGSLTVFAFSSENWRRPQQEVDDLMRLFLQALEEEVAELHDNGIQLRFIGDLSQFSTSLRENMQRAVALTASNQRLIFNVAVNYGGRWDMVQAARSVAEQVFGGSLNVDDIDEHVVHSYTSLAHQPELDLCIRTGGEQRVSNFLLWQVAYSELYFTDCLWPDFDDMQLDLAIHDYARRQRRFGRTGDQVLAHQEYFE